MIVNALTLTFLCLVSSVVCRRQELDLESCQFSRSVVSRSSLRFLKFLVVSGRRIVLVDSFQLVKNTPRVENIWSEGVFDSTEGCFLETYVQDPGRETLPNYVNAKHAHFISCPQKQGCSDILLWLLQKQNWLGDSFLVQTKQQTTNNNQPKHDLAHTHFENEKKRLFQLLTMPQSYLLLCQRKQQ